MENWDLNWGHMYVTCVLLHRVTFYTWGKDHVTYRYTASVLYTLGCNPSIRVHLLWRSFRNDSDSLTLTFTVICKDKRSKRKGEHGKKLLGSVMLTLAPTLPSQHKRFSSYSPIVRLTMLPISTNAGHLLCCPIIVVTISLLALLLLVFLLTRQQFFLHYYHGNNGFVVK